MNSFTTWQHRSCRYVLKISLIIALSVVDSVFRGAFRTKTETMGEGNSFQRLYAQNSSPSSVAWLEFLMNVVPYTSSRSKPLRIEIHDEENWNSLKNLLSACHLDNSSGCVVSSLGWDFHLVIGTLSIPRIVKVHCRVRDIENDCSDCHFTTFMTEVHARSA